MRHRTEPEPITRLLIQKPAAFADLDENARIAISVLGDNGWNIQRVGLELEIKFVATPIDGGLAATAALAEAEARFAALGTLVKKQELRAATQAWLTAATGVAVGSLLAFLSAYVPSLVLFGACLSMAFLRRYVTSTKGAA